MWPRPRKSKCSYFKISQIIYENIWNYIKFSVSSLKLSKSCDTIALRGSQEVGYEQRTAIR